MAVAEAGSLTAAAAWAPAYFAAVSQRQIRDLEDQVGSSY